MKTLLIFAHECVPFNRIGSTIGAQRPAQFAKHLAAFGWRTIVICCDANQRRSITKKDIPGIVSQALKTLTESKVGEPVIIATPSLYHEGIIDALWHKLVKTNKDGTFSEKNKIYSILRKPITFLKFFTGDFSQSWIPVAKAVATSIHKESKIDFCIAEHGPDAGLFLARWFHKKYNVKWIADFRDPILRSYSGFSRMVYKKISKFLLKSASATINVNSYWAELDKQHFKLPIFVLPNGFDKQEYNFKTARNTQFTVSYFGNFNKKIQDMDMFFKGLELVKRKLSSADYTSFKFLYRGRGHHEILHKAKQYNVEEIVDSQETVPRSEIIRLMMNADLLLLLSIAPYLKLDIFFSKGLHPGKTFEYFGAQRPILCIPGDKGMLDELIRESKTGQIKSNEQEIAEYLVHAFNEWKQGKQVPYTPSASRENYTRGNQAHQLSEILNKYSN